MFLPFDTHLDFQFCVVGVSHWNTPLAIREKFSFNEEKLKHFYQDAKKLGIDNLFVLSTCNRTEFYSDRKNISLLHQLVEAIYQEDVYCLFQQYIYEKYFHEAVLHLFHVTSGLYSQILGDFEIVGQVKQALQNGIRYNNINHKMIRLIEHAIKCSKEIKSNTSITSGTSSIASSAVQFLQKNITSLANKKVLLIGVGKIGRTTCDNLTKQINAENITVVNRTYSKALQTANYFGLHAAKYEVLHALINTHDIIIVATGAPSPVITVNTFQNITAKGKVLLDLSVPRNIDTEVYDIPGIEVVNIEQLEDIKNESLALRQLSVPKAKQIIHEYILQYYDWLHTTPVFPAIEKLTLNFGSTDLKNIITKLKEIEIISDTETNYTEEKLLGLCIKYLKENYYKPEVNQWYQETFQHSLQTVKAI